MAWNSLPDDLHDLSRSTGRFKRTLNTALSHLLIYSAQQRCRIKSGYIDLLLAHVSNAELPIKAKV